MPTAIVQQIAEAHGLGALDVWSVLRSQIDLTPDSLGRAVIEARQIVDDNTALICAR
jgi:hypothetical protein